MPANTAPGFIDIQLNGFAGVDFSDPHLEPEQAAAVLPALWRTGVTAFCPTLITNGLDRLARNFRVLESARRAFPRFAACVPGYHLEGPWLSPGNARGVHDPRWMQAPDWDAFCRLQEAAGGRIAIVTLAPELSGALDFIARLARAGVIAALGHTEASPEQVHQAADAGATLSTHLGNGCPQMLDRHYNPLWAQMADDRLSAGLICDTFHLPPDVVQVIVRAKTVARCILVTDATHVAALPPGPYQIAGTPIELLPSGKVIRADGGCLAGSAISMDRSVTGFMQLSGCSLEAALDAAARHPAKLLGPRVEPAGTIRYRLEAGNLRIQATSVAGEEVYAGD